MTPEPERSPHDENLRHVVAGMLSTTTYIPSQTHPESMLELADTVIRHIRNTDAGLNQVGSGIDTVSESPTDRRLNK